MPDATIRARPFAAQPAQEPAEDQVHQGDPRRGITPRKRDDDLHPLIVSTNPFDRSDRVGEFPISSADEIADVLNRARDVRREWNALPATARADALYAAAAGLEANKVEVTNLVVREVGKPVVEARGELKRGIDILRYHAGSIMMPSGDTLPGSTVTGIQFTTRRPLGTVAVVTPWNFPVAIPLWKVVPALAWGTPSSSSRRRRLSEWPPSWWRFCPSTYPQDC